MSGFKRGFIEGLNDFRMRDVKSAESVSTVAAGAFSGILITHLAPDSWVLLLISALVLGAVAIVRTVWLKVNESHK